MTANLAALYELASRRRFRIKITYVPRGARYRVTVQVGRPDYMEPCRADMFAADVPVGDAIDKLARQHVDYFGWVETTGHSSWHRPRNETANVESDDHAKQDD